MAEPMEAWREAAFRIMEEEHAGRRRLRFALLSRVLTDEEMTAVEREGSRLFEPADECYRQKDVDRAFAAALLQQFKLRTIARLTSVEAVVNGCQDG